MEVESNSCWGTLTLMSSDAVRPQEREASSAAFMRQACLGIASLRESFRGQGRTVRRSKNIWTTLPRSLRTKSDGLIQKKWLQSINNRPYKSTNSVGCQYRATN